MFTANAILKHSELKLKKDDLSLAVVNPTAGEAVAKFKLPVPHCYFTEIDIELRLLTGIKDEADCHINETETLSFQKHSVRKYRTMDLMETATTFKNTTKLCQEVNCYKSLYRLFNLTYQLVAVVNCNSHVHMKHKYKLLISCFL